MKIAKSSRHSKITGNFAESLVLYWLSKYGFECALVDHTGIDIIARQPKSRELLGISVKSRSRTDGKESSVLRIDRKQLPAMDAACRAFQCKPYFAIVVDAADSITAWIVEQKRLLKICDWKQGRDIYWKMTNKQQEKYQRDAFIRTFRLTTETFCWWN